MMMNSRENRISVPMPEKVNRNGVFRKHWPESEKLMSIDKKRHIGQVKTHYCLPLFITSVTVLFSNTGDGKALQKLLIQCKIMIIFLASKTQKSLPTV